jgi:integrase
MRQQGHSEDTIRRRIGTCTRFGVFLGGSAIAYAETSDVEAFLSRYRSPATRHAYLSDLKAYYRWLIRRRWIDGPAPTDVLDSVKVPEAMPRPLTAEELMRAVATADDRLRLVLLLGALAGLRRQEIAGLHGEDIGDHVLRVRKPKGGRQRVIPVHPVLMAELASYGVRKGPLFPQPGTPHLPVSRDRIGLWVTRHFEQLGIEGSCHRLRHSAASALAAVSQDPYVVAQFLGHKTLNQSLTYVQMDGRKLGEHVGRMPDPTVDLA